MMCMVTTLRLSRSLSVVSLTYTTVLPYECGAACRLDPPPTLHFSWVLVFVLAPKNLLTVWFCDIWRCKCQEVISGVNQSLLEDCSGSDQRNEYQQRSSRTAAWLVTVPDWSVLKYWYGPLHRVMLWVFFERLFWFGLTGQNTGQVLAYFSKGKFLLGAALVILYRYKYEA